MSEEKFWIVMNGCGQQSKKFTYRIDAEMEAKRLITKQGWNMTLYIVEAISKVELYAPPVQITTL